MSVLFLFAPTFLLAQSQSIQEKDGFRAIVKDMKGEKLEGNLRFHSDEITVCTKDGQEKSLPLKIIESIKVEKIQGGIPGADQPGAESYYSVRIQNSQEIFTLKKKVTFTLNTSAGVVTRTLDPQTGSSRKDSPSVSKSQSESSLVRGEGVALSLEIKF